MSASVLFDAPGPRGRAVSAVGNVVAALAVLAGLGWLVSVLAAKGQFEPSLWQNAVSAEAWQFYYLPGLQNTLRSASSSCTPSCSGPPRSSRPRSRTRCRRWSSWRSCSS